MDVVRSADERRERRVAAEAQQEREVAAVSAAVESALVGTEASWGRGGGLRAARVLRSLTWRRSGPNRSSSRRYSGAERGRGDRRPSLYSSRTRERCSSVSDNDDSDGEATGVHHATRGRGSDDVASDDDADNADGASGAGGDYWREGRCAGGAEGAGGADAKSRWSRQRQPWAGPERRAFEERRKELLERLARGGDGAAADGPSSSAAAASSSAAAASSLPPMPPSKRRSLSVGAFGASPSSAAGAARLLVTNLDAAAAAAAAPPPARPQQTLQVQPKSPTPPTAVKPGETSPRRAAAAAAAALAPPKSEVGHQQAAQLQRVRDLAREAPPSVVVATHSVSTRLDALLQTKKT